MPTPKERLEAWRNKRIALYLVEHKRPPLCACGCGGEVNFDERGEPNTWIHKHHYKAIAGPIIKRARQEYLSTNLPVEPVREAFLKIKKDRGLTWQQFADQGGISLNHVRVFMFGKNQATVSREWTRDVLTRLAGGSAPISKYQERRAKQFRRAEKSINREYHEPKRKG